MKPITSLSNYALAILLMASAITACKKDNAQQPDTNTGTSTKGGYANISYYASSVGGPAKKTGSSDLKINATGTSTVAIDWASATVYVEKLTLSIPNSVDTTVTVEKNLNIFSASALAGVVQLPSGSYKNVKLRLFCRKSPRSELAFNFRGTFTNTKGTKDSILVASSFPFEADVTVADIVVNASDKYKATFSFDLNKVLVGISNQMLETSAKSYTKDNKKMYAIAKGGSADEPFYDQVIGNWQSVASVVVSKE
ncbi:hypothetical protein [Mucilaginibacter myungsuensis]|uniref:DUF4382 domain-containing protein n=1 Tax=Mucilaginibacter myungsuensis TaxID=649104 RepID=A0A929PX12_9SPHI|nr:hypothetical protein [Mucilaginibacter myungsuensis]MBE9662676.1 hypothetical protein [Mucilaginibacter myungsuensis]MDN3598096.1 hypothetical protein [Mucilaginibacter myungsuensis]